VPLASLPMTTTTVSAADPGLAPGRAPDLAQPVSAVVIASPERFCRFGGMYQAIRTVIEVETWAQVLAMFPGGGVR